MKTKSFIKNKQLINDSWLPNHLTFPMAYIFTDKRSKAILTTVILFSVLLLLIPFFVGGLKW